MPSETCLWVCVCSTLQRIVYLTENGSREGSTRQHIRLSLGGVRLTLARGTRNRRVSRTSLPKLPAIVTPNIYVCENNPKESTIDRLIISTRAQRRNTDVVCGEEKNQKNKIKSLEPVTSGWPRGPRPLGANSATSRPRHFLRTHAVTNARRALQTWMCTTMCTQPF